MNFKNDVEVGQLGEQPTKEEIMKIDQEIDSNTRQQASGEKHEVKIPKDLLKYKYKLEQHLHKIEMKKEAPKQAPKPAATASVPGQAFQQTKKW